MSVLKDFIEDKKVAKTLLYAGISAAAGYAITGLLAGRSVVKLGILIAVGTNPVTAALAALAGTVAYRIFKFILVQSEIDGAGGNLASLPMGAYVLSKVLSGSLTETLVIGGAAYLANFLFMSIFAKRKIPGYKYLKDASLFDTYVLPVVKYIFRIKEEKPIY